MAERFLFFNAMEIEPGVFDREYRAQDFADYFGSVLSIGLLHTNEIPGMQVSVEAGTMNTIVTSGKAIMRGHLYENTTPLTLTHAIPEPDLDRIDRVVLRLNLSNSERNIKLRVVTGEPSANPVAPELTRSQFIHEISLARIRVRANTVQLQQSDLIDERLYEDLCGLVSSLISIPTSQFQEQWDLFFAQKSAELEQATEDYEAHTLAEQQRILDATNEYVQAVVDAENQLKNSLAGFESQWNDWFSQQQTEGFLLASEKGQPEGVASLDSGGTVPHDQLPSLDFVPTDEKGSPDGVATLDGGGDIPLDQLGNVQYLNDFYGKKGVVSFLGIVQAVSEGYLDSVFNVYDRGFPSGSKELYRNEQINLGYQSATLTVGINQEDGRIKVEGSTLSSATQVSLRTIAPYDLTDIDSIEIDREITTGSYLRYKILSPSGSVRLNETSSGMDRRTVTVDVSGFTGDHHLELEFYSSSNRMTQYLYDVKFIHSSPKDLRLVESGKFSEPTSLQLGEGTLSSSIEFPFQIVEGFLDWYSLNSMVDLPNGTDAEFDIYDNYDNPLRMSVMNGESLKGLANPKIKVRVTLSRMDTGTPSPTFNWIEMGMRGISTSQSVELVESIELSEATVSFLLDASNLKYKEIQILLVGRSTAANNSYVDVVYNGDTRASRYRYTWQAGSTASGGAGTQIPIPTASEFSIDIRMILPHKNTERADEIIFRSDAVSNGSTPSMLIGNYQEKVPLEDILIKPRSGSFEVGTKMEIWGTI